MATAHRVKLWLPKNTKTPLSSLPDFLLPAFQSLPQSTTNRSFATSSPHASRVGAASITIPPEVNLRLLEPPKRRGVITRTPPPKVIEIQGPLGKAAIPLPPFVSYALNDATRKATLSVTDRKARDQREMWGLSIFLFIPFPLSECKNRRG